MKNKKVAPIDYLNLLSKYGLVSYNDDEVSKIKLKDLNFENVPEVKKALDGLDISKCDFVVLSTGMTKESFDVITLSKPGKSLNAIKHYVNSYTPDRGDLPIGVVNGDVSYNTYTLVYDDMIGWNVAKTFIEEFFNKTLPESIKAAREIWEPSMKDFAIEITKRKRKLEAASKGLQETKNRFYKFCQKKKQLMKDFKD